MKSIALLSLFLLSSVSQAECVNFSGTYKAKVTKENPSAETVRIVQSSCDALQFSVEDYAGRIHSTIYLKKIETYGPLLEQAEGVSFLGLMSDRFISSTIWSKQGSSISLYTMEYRLDSDGNLVMNYYANGPVYKGHKFWERVRNN